MLNLLCLVEGALGTVVGWALEVEVVGDNHSWEVEVVEDDWAVMSSTRCLVNTENFFHYLKQKQTP